MARRRWQRLLLEHTLDFLRSTPGTGLGKEPPSGGTPTPTSICWKYAKTIARQRRRRKREQQQQQQQQQEEEQEQRQWQCQPSEMSPPPPLPPPPPAAWEQNEQHQQLHQRGRITDSVLERYATKEERRRDEESLEKHNFPEKKEDGNHGPPPPQQHQHQQHQQQQQRRVADRVTQRQDLPTAGRRERSEEQKHPEAQEVGNVQSPAREQGAGFSPPLPLFSEQEEVEQQQ
ncbi:unnamed protein product, partial [Hapterophycus canaliculatus]